MNSTFGARMFGVFMRLVLWLGLLVFSQAQAGTLGAVALSPASITVGVPSSVTFTVSITDPAYIVGSGNVQRLRADGRVQGVVGTLRDDGLGGDAVAGDKVYTLRLAVQEALAGAVKFQISAGFRGELRRTIAGPVTLTVESVANVSIPAVVGLTQAAAIAAITNAGLAVGTVTQASSATVPAGSVISQNPAAGTSVPPGSTVNLVVSTGPANVAVPDVVNLTQAAATTAITNAGLAVGTVTQASSATVPAGSVISQNPAAGTSVPPGSTVNLVVSTGPANVAVPDVVNLTQAAATTAITNAGLAVGTVTQASSATVPAGSVISQNPAAGTSVPPGSTVNLVVSTGPANVAVPDVVNLTQAAATTAITNAGLAVGTVTQASSATVPAGSVISQNPAAGTSVPPGSTVNLVVSTGPANVAVPDVVNLTQAAATTAITNAGLAVGTVTLANSATVPAGSVISQNPAAGASVAPGSAVDLVVSVGPSVGPVPASVELQLGSLVVAAGGTTPIVTIVRDAGNQPIVPTPAVTYAILSPAGNLGTVPTAGGAPLSVLTSADTRGAYTLQATVDGTAITASVSFAVIEAAQPAGATLGNGERLVAFGVAGGAVADKVAAIAAALASGDTASIPALNTALQAAAAAVPVSGRNGMERTTAVAPDRGFLPTTSFLTSRGFPETAGDVSFGNLLTQIDAKVAQITTFYANLNPASATDDEATLNQLNGELAVLLDQLITVNVTPHGVVKHASRLNVLLGQTIPRHLQGLSSRVNTVLVANLLASNQTTPAEFYAALAQAGGEQALPAAAYQRPQPAFFGLVGLMAGSSIQMNLVNRLYGKYLEEVTRMMILLGANSLLQDYLNSAGMEGIITGASLSFHVPNRAGSVIEGTGHNSVASRNDVFFVGPDAVAAVQGVLSSFNPSSVESLEDLYEFFDGIVSALEAAGEAYQNAHRLPSRVNFGGCILDFGASPSCTQLEYDAGFPDVNDGFLPSPVIILVHNLDTGTWSQGIFNFVAN